MQFNQQRMLDRLVEMIKIDSVSFEEKEMSDYLEKYWTERGLEVYRDQAGAKFGGNGSNILVHIPGNMPGEAICYNAHQDTVEPGRGIQPVLEGNLLRSSGDTILGADDKSGIAMLMEAYDVLQETKTPHREIYYLFTICEEQNMNGSKNFDLSKLPCKNIYSLDGAGNLGNVNIAGPAKDGIKVTFKGRKAHAGIEPEKGINAAVMLAKAISQVKFGRIDKETTSNVGRISGGDMTNVVTDEAFFTAEVRSHSPAKLNEQVELIRQASNKAAQEMGGKALVTISHDYPSIKTDFDSFLYQKIVEIYQKEGFEIHKVISGGGGDCNIFAGHGFICDGISTGMKDVHSSKETLDLTVWMQAMRLLYRSMTE